MLNTNKLNIRGKEYLYDLSIIYSGGPITTTLLPAMVKSIIIDYNYDKHYMPVIYMTVAFTMELYLTVVDNANDGRFIINMKKFVNDNSTIKKDFIKSSFAYFIPTNMNKRFKKSEDEEKQSYITCTIGLIDMKLLENNNLNFNGVFKSTNNVSLAQFAVKNMNMVFEPFSNIQKIDQLLVPPMSTVYKFLKYVDGIYPFYNTPFRFFMDFNETYLLSENGNPVDKRDRQYNKINVSVITEEYINMDEYKGVIINDKNQLYYIYADLNDTILKVNRYVGKDMTKIIGVDNEGYVSTMEVNTERGAKDKDKQEFIYSTTQSAINNYKKGLENSLITLTFAKSDIDTSIITPNKRIVVRNYETNSKYNGNYLLSNKQDIFTPNGNEYIINTRVSLRKIN